MGVSKTTDHIQIKIKMPNPSQEPPASSKAQNQDLNDMEVLCTFKTGIEPKFGSSVIKDQGPYPNQDQDAKLQSGTSSILQISKWGHRGHWCSLHLQNQDRELKFGSWVYQRQVTIYKSRSSILQSPKGGLKGHGCSLHLQNKDWQPKFGTWVFQRPLTISISISRCQTPVRNLQRPPKP